jgi:hypothetical protein
MARQASLTSVLIIWLLPQLVALALSALRVPLSAHPPRPLESIALPQMIVVQMVAAGMLAPWLFRTAGAVVAVVVSAAPMLALAGVLSFAAPKLTSMLFLLLATWVAAVGAACLALAPRQRFIACALATAWSLGGLALAYLHAEFAPQRRVPELILGPASVAARCAASQNTGSALVALVVVLSIMVIFAGYLAHHRQHGADATG